VDEWVYEGAQALTERLRQAGIDEARSAPTEQPLEVNGQRLCKECEEPLSPARLNANPSAVRCVECQTDHDRRGG